MLQANDNINCDVHVGDTAEESNAQKNVNNKVHNRNPKPVLNKNKLNNLPANPETIPKKKDVDKLKRKRDLSVDQEDRAPLNNSNNSKLTDSTNVDLNNDMSDVNVSNIDTETNISTTNIGTDHDNRINNFEDFVEAAVTVDQNNPLSVKMSKLDFKEVKCPDFDNVTKAKLKSKITNWKGSSVEIEELNLKWDHKKIGCFCRLK